MAPDASLSRRMDGIERNLSDHAKTISVVVDDQRDLKDILAEIVAEKKVETAVRGERDKNLYERLERMEKKFTDGIDAVKADVNDRFSRLNKPIWIAVAALISTAVATIAGFAFRGGFGG